MVRAYTSMFLRAFGPAEVVMPKLTHAERLNDATRQEVIDACLQIDRARHDELGRMAAGDVAVRASAREQPAAAIDLTDVDE
jgi:hypothetical protein